MAQGRTNLGKVQFGHEATPGTSVAATSTWRGAASFIEDQRLVKIVEEQVGILGGTNRSYIPEILAGIKFADTELTFENNLLIAVVAAGWCSPSGTADGSGSDYIFTANVPTTSTLSMTGKTFTFRAGDDHEAEIMEYGFFSDFSIKGAIREAMKFSGTAMGRQATQGSFTNLGTTLPTVDEVLFQQAKLFLDAVGGSYGGTQVANQVVGFELNVKTGVKPQFTADGNLYFSQLLQADPEITGKVSFLHDSGADGASGEKSKWRSETPRLLQLKVTGPALSLAGTTYSNKTLIINLPIKWTKFSPLSNKDGATLVTGEFVAKFDSTKGDAGQIILVNELAVAQ